MSMDDIFKAAGGVTKLARSLGLHHTTVMGWTAVPPKHVRAVCSLTGITAHELRPDLWDETESAPKAAEAAKAEPSKSDAPAKAEAA